MWGVFLMSEVPLYTFMSSHLPRGTRDSVSGEPSRTFDHE